MIKRCKEGKNSSGLNADRAERAERAERGKRQHLRQRQVEYSSTERKMSVDGIKSSQARQVDRLESLM